MPRHECKLFTLHHLRGYTYYAGLLTWRGNRDALERLNVAIAGNIEWLRQFDEEKSEPQMPCRAQVGAQAAARDQKIMRADREWRDGRESESNRQRGRRPGHYFRSAAQYQ